MLRCGFIWADQLEKLGFIAVQKGIDLNNFIPRHYMIEDDFIDKVDLYCLERWYEKFSQFTQRWFGLDCFFWANVGIYIFLADHARRIVTQHILHRNFVAIIISIAICVFVFWRVRPLIEYAKTLAYSNRQSGFQNAMKIRFSWQRQFSGFLSIYCFISYTTEGAHWLWFIAICMANTGHLTFMFASCTPLPPGKSKVRQSLERASEMLNNALSPGATSPVPA